MRVYVSFDDTDCLGADRGTGKLVRWFTERLPEGCTSWGVVRQQLLVHPDVPYTSHNSSGCAVLDVPDASYLPLLANLGAAHIAEHFIDGSDPGLCIADENTDLSAIIAFASRAAIEVVTQDEARAIAEEAGVHLSGHGGTEDGVIGALAGVGLTASGWSGRLVEFHRPLRDFPIVTTVAEVEDAGIMVVPVDRNVQMPKPTDTLDTQGWLRPRLWGGRPVAPVTNTGPDSWTAIGKQRPAGPGGTTPGDAHAGVQHGGDDW
ncbi:MAG: Conserved hypothetical cytosolic protein [Actinobacteria bacterium 66_15]|nr:MAG: Conserved hypothetical cytosolic protein [Actinobacteria bacterium 66_15]